MPKKTVAILTSEESFLNNYGAALQGYALYATLEELGLSPSIVRYQGGEARNSQIAYRLFQMKRALGRKYHNLVDPKPKALDAVVLKKIQDREDMFRCFSQTYLSFWNEKRVSWQQLRKVYPKCDCYVCGSDQIWNPYFKNGYNDPGYFLAFAPKNSIKISYAPSFGCDDIPGTAAKTLGGLLKDFKAISVREKSGVDIVRKYANREAEHVLDPTLLRTDSQWRQISHAPQGLPKKYILCYRFANSDLTRNMINQISGRTGWPVISLPLSMVALRDEYRSIFEAGPREFIGLIDNASLVCTDSFHATVFSVLMNTPVCVFLRESYENGNSMNSRVYSLMRMLRLESHIITPNAALEKAMKCLEEDYVEAHKILDDERKKSMLFLKRALEFV